jgi:photosystem II stability/assembly factor-like uncharacterized protein
VGLSVKILLIVYILLVLILPPSIQAQWIKQNFPTNEWLWRVRFADEMVGWVLGHDFIYKTTDGGLTWTPQDSSLGYGEALYVLNNQTVFYATGYNPFWQRGIRRTTDGGLSWETVDTDHFFYTDFEFINDQTGFAVGMDENNINTVRMTTNGGETWNSVSTNFRHSGYELTGITFVGEQIGWIASYDGYIYKTMNGGLNWVLQDSLKTPPAWQPVRDILFVTPDSGWAVGGIGWQSFTARTTDGGENWSQDIRTGSDLQEVQFVNCMTGWAVGLRDSYTCVVKTTNGGLDWQPQSHSPQAYGFTSISMINENIGWIVADFGYVYKTTNGGIVGIEETTTQIGLSDNFTLKQNYPNPFNPKTIIEFDLPKSTLVTLTVFNILREEVATLVSDRLSSGSYSYEWDATNLASGVYLYRLQAGDPSQGAGQGYVETRKMVLMR